MTLIKLAKIDRQTLGRVENQLDRNIKAWSQAPSKTNKKIVGASNKILEEVIKDIIERYPSLRDSPEKENHFIWAPRDGGYLILDGDISQFAFTSPFEFNSERPPNMEAINDISLIRKAVKEDSYKSIEKIGDSLILSGQSRLFVEIYDRIRNRQ